MTYVMSDLHGQYEQFIKMLELIAFSDEDELYILGDIVDRGPNPIKILMDISMRPNVFAMMGNHEHMALGMLKKLYVKITEENYATHLDTSDISALSMWLVNGGETTLNEFRLLGDEDKDFILDYLQDFSIFEEISVGERDFVLVHGGLPDFSPDKDLFDYPPIRSLYTVTDYQKQYYPDKYLITGHYPTLEIGKEYVGKIYRKHHHIAIDCGSVYGYTLGCIRLDDMQEFYVS